MQEIKCFFHANEIQVNVLVDTVVVFTFFKIIFSLLLKITSQFSSTFSYFTCIMRTSYLRVKTVAYNSYQNFGTFNDDNLPNHQHNHSIIR